jgi:hypothetical protein
VGRVWGIVKYLFKCFRNVITQARYILKRNIPVAGDAYDNWYKTDSRHWRNGDFHDFSLKSNGEIHRLLASIAENTGTAGADSGNVRGAECAKFIQWVGLAEYHYRRKLVVDHYRGSVKPLPAIWVNRVSVVV